MKKVKLLIWKKEWLIKLGDIALHTEDRKNWSYCEQNKTTFNYCWIQNALCGKIEYYEEENCKSKGNFTLKKFFVTQMK